MWVQLEAEIETAIKELSGQVAPKFNWSVPTDAVWMGASGLKCFRASDVFVLLKASDKVAHDVHETIAEAGGEPDAPLTQTTVQWTLALRKWSNLVPSSEFRCFVLRSKLIGRLTTRLVHWLMHCLADSGMPTRPRTVL